MFERQNSEVARLLAQINAEYESAQRGLSGLAQGTSQHRFMTKRTERIAEYHEQLRSLVGDEAMALIDQDEETRRTIGIELEDDQEELDSELMTAIARKLRETREYAVDPQRRGKLLESVRRARHE